MQISLKEATVLTGFTEKTLRGIIKSNNCPLGLIPNNPGTSSNEWVFNIENVQGYLDRSAARQGQAGVPTSDQVIMMIDVLVEKGRIRNAAQIALSCYCGLRVCGDIQA